MRTDFRFSSYFDYPSPFTLGPKQRPLRVFIDSKNLGNDSASEALEEFASHDALIVNATHQHGTDCIVFGDVTNDTLLATVQNDGRSTQAGVMFVSQWEHFARIPILKDGLTLPQGPWNELDYRRRQYIVAKLAESMNVDLFVTNDRFLLEFRRPDFIPLNFASSIDAVALIGSHLRNRRDFTIQKEGRITRKLGRGLFYTVLARELLPDGWRWFSAIVASDLATGGSLTGTGQSVHTRMMQVLKAQDHVHWQLLQTHNNETADDILFYLDMMLLSLAAAFDVMALIADVSLGLANPSRRVSWSDTKWRNALRNESRAMDCSMTLGQVNGRIHRLLSLLRNTIHGAALRTMGFQEGSSPLENVLVLPKEHREELKHLFNALGGLECWGFEEITTHFAYVKPGMLAEQLLLRAADALSNLMALTPVEKLPGLDATAKLMSGPPRMDMWSDWTRQRVRLLSGV